MECASAHPVIVCLSSCAVVLPCSCISVLCSSGARPRFPLPPPHLFSLMIGGGEGMWCWCIFITLPSSLPLISLPPFLLRFSIFFSSLWTPGLCLCVTLWEQGPFARLRTFSNSTLSMVWMGKRGALTSLLWKVTHPGFVVFSSVSFSFYHYGSVLGLLVCCSCPS